jgi:exopolysaccharide biosynthesis polyprenyl glycosylphosphotransferase
MPTNDTDCFPHRLFFLLLDVFALSAAWHCAVGARLALNPLFAREVTYAELMTLAPPLSMVLVLWTGYRLMARPMKARPGERITAGMLELSTAALAAGGLAIVVAFFFRELGAEVSRSFVILFVMIGFITLLLGRYAGRFLLFYGEVKMRAQDRVAIVGRPQAAAQLALAMTARPGSDVAGVIHLCGSTTSTTSPVAVLGTTDHLAELVNRSQLNRLVLSEEPMDETDFIHCIRVSERMGVVLTRVVGMQVPGTEAGIVNIGGVPHIEYRRSEPSVLGQRIKSVLDIFIAFFALLILSPLMIFIALLIRLTSSGPVLYTSDRVGRGGRHFKFLKFRSMYHNTNRQLVNEKNEKNGHVFKIRKDPRVTPVGRWLRRWSLDELPQFINVLRGDMSVVGPRPLPASDLDPDGQSKQFARWAEERSRVLPGITGLWQVRGRSDLVFEDLVQLDLEYLNRRSISFDLRILLETPLVVLVGRGAY